MFESIINYISQLDPISIYLAVFFIAYIENIFPPSPSDVIVAFAASLVVSGKINLFVILITAVIGSTTGFITMYLVGRLFGRKVIDSGKLKFISKESIEKFEKQFIKYGMFLIVINRFLAGTRAIVSFFAGMSELPLTKTIVLSAISSLLWNSLLVYLGYVFGNNIEMVDYYLATYNKIIMIVITIIILFFVIRFYLKKRKANNENKI